MMRKNLTLLVFLILGLSGCQTISANLGPLSGRVILWHSWTPDETDVLDQALAEFRESNPQVNVDSRVYPTVSGFSRQARTAVILPNELDEDRFYAAGDRAYASALAGLLTPEEAVCRFGQEVAAFHRYSKSEIILPAGCTLIPTEPTSN